MDWCELQIKVPVARLEQAEAIANMAVPYGIYTEDYSDLEIAAQTIAHIDLIDEELVAKDRSTAIIHIYISKEEAPAEAAAYLTALYEAEGIPFTLQTETIREADWADGWKPFFKCTPIGKRLLIKPRWEKYAGEPRTVLEIDPGAAFGTGTHATTRMCLEVLDAKVVSGQTVLDIGSGSGILSIAAVLLGAESAVGVDIDATAVRVAAENAAMNKVQDRVQYLQGDLTDKVSGQFDIVCANIVADAIISLQQDVAGFLKPGGIFLCSGIIDVRSDDVLAAFQKNNFEILETHTYENWYAFVAQPKGGAQ